jgi:hypothetical protein
MGVPLASMRDHRLSDPGKGVLTITKAFGGFHALEGSKQGLIKVDGTFT